VRLSIKLPSKNPRQNAPAGAPLPFNPIEPELAEIKDSGDDVGQLEGKKYKPDDIPTWMPFGTASEKRKNRLKILTSMFDLQAPGNSQMPLVRGPLEGVGSPFSGEGESPVQAMNEGWDPAERMKKGLKWITRIPEGISSREDNLVSITNESNTNDGE
jgi:hypothetical protein